MEKKTAADVSQQKAMHTSGLENTQNISNLRSRQGAGLDDSLITSGVHTHNDVSQLGGANNTTTAVIDNSVFTAQDATARGDPRALRGVASVERGTTNHQIQITNQGPLPGVASQDEGANRQGQNNDYVALNHMKNAQSERTIEAVGKHQQMQS